MSLRIKGKLHQWNNIINYDMLFSEVILHKSTKEEVLMIKFNSNRYTVKGKDLDEAIDRMDIFINYLVDKHRFKKDVSKSDVWRSVGRETESMGGVSEGDKDTETGVLCSHNTEGELSGVQDDEGEYQASMLDTMPGKSGGISETD